MKDRASELEATIPPCHIRSSTSVALRISSLRRRSLSATALFSRSCPLLPNTEFVFRPSASHTEGESNGVEVPESGSFLPLNPLCDRALGAGSTLRKCSSSASVPLSLVRGESRAKAGNGREEVASESSAILSPSPIVIRGPVMRPEGSRSSVFNLWYGCGERDNSLR